MSQARRTDCSLRRHLRSADREPLRTLLDETGFFNREEIGVAMELVEDGLALGEGSHYRFIVAEIGKQVAGYACWGPIPGTADSADLYWIAVHPDRQGHGVGRALLTETESWMISEDRVRVWIETAGRALYGPTRAFYLGCGYLVAAELEDYYGPGDPKLIFSRVLRRS